MIRKIIIIFLGIMLLPTFQASANADAKIVVEMQYSVISPTEDGSVEFMEMVSYKNQSSEEYNGDGTTEGVISVPLPENATKLQMNDEKIDYKETEAGFVTTTPIPANGSLVLQFSYQLPYGKEFALTFPYGIGMYQILIPEGAGSLEIKGVEATSSVMDIDGKNYSTYSVQNIQPNQSITIAYDKDKQPEGGASQETTEDTKTENTGNVTKVAPDFHNPGHLRMWYQSPLKEFNPHYLMIVLGVILIAGIGYWSYFRMKNNANKNSGSDKDEQAFKTLMAKQKAILDKILELEELYDKGQISEEDYHTKLDAYKHHLVQVKLSLREYIE
jgi:hypothetical protein